MDGIKRNGLCKYNNAGLDDKLWQAAHIGQFAGRMPGRGKMFLMFLQSENGDCGSNKTSVTCHEMQHFELEKKNHPENINYKDAWHYANKRIEDPITSSRV